MDFLKLIKNWHEQAKVNSDPFSKYVFEYLAFIAYLKRVQFIGQDSDMAAIRDLKNDNHFRKTYLNTVKKNERLVKSWQSIITELDQHPIGVLDANTDEVRTIWYWDCDCNTNNDRNHYCNTQGRIRDIDDWKNMVEFWHTIRNNLFHGGKNPSDSRDQLFVREGYETLSAFMDQVLV